MGRYLWSRLNHLQVGRFAEYYVKMEFALYAFEIFTSEVDDRGIDFITRHENTGFLEIQVKAVRGNNYVFMQKDKFPLRSDRLAAVVTLIDGQPPSLFLIPSLAWMMPDALLVSRDYEGKKSKPEWGINLSHRNRPLLDKFNFDVTVTSILAEANPLFANQPAASTQPH